MTNENKSSDEQRSSPSVSNLVGDIVMDKVKGMINQQPDGINIGNLNIPMSERNRNYLYGKRGV